MKVRIKNVSPLLLLVVVVVVALAAVGIWYFYTTKLGAQSSATFHEHANFAVYINDAVFDFNQSKYMTNENQEVGLRAYVHMHDMDGGLIHLHEPDLTMGEFFQTIGMQLNSTCLTVDNGTSYCTDANESLKMYVNGVQSNQFDSLNPQDLDKMLISYGPHEDSNIQSQLASIESDACIYSNKCPAPPGFMNNETLSCAVGQASVCTGK